MKYLLILKFNNKINNIIIKKMNYFKYQNKLIKD